MEIYVYEGKNEEHLRQRSRAGIFRKRQRNRQCQKAAGEIPEGVYQTAQSSKAA